MTSLDLRYSDPRPLTGDERAVPRETIAALLRDVEAYGRALPEIREEAHSDYGENAVCAWIQDNGRCGQGIRVWLSFRKKYHVHTGIEITRTLRPMNSTASIEITRAYLALESDSLSSFTGSSAAKYAPASTSAQ